MTGTWRRAVCVGARSETSSARTIRLRIDGSGGSGGSDRSGGSDGSGGLDVLPGQHVDVRLTADDGYQAVRSYSLSAVPSRGPAGHALAADEVELTVEKLADGEVSPYLVDGLEVGDPVEIRGPIGGWFVWHEADPAPVQLIGGGSGVAPLMAMLRARAASATSAADFRLVYSMRVPASEYFRAELAALEAAGTATVDRVYTRVAPPGSSRPPGRLDTALLESLVLPPGASVFVCGPNGFVAAVAASLVELGHDPALIRTERFGGA